VSRKTATPKSRLSEDPLGHYTLKSARCSSHYYGFLLAQGAVEILELGCGKGHFSEQLIESGNRVTGIDVLPPSAVCVPGLEYIPADLNSQSLGAMPRLSSRRFGRILMMDVLEHLLDPERVLRESARLLAPGGSVIVSLPNVANLWVRLMLLLGRWDYTDRGILDRTHLRFYTRKTARHLLVSSGYAIEKEIATVIPAELAFRLSHRNLLMIAINRTLAAATRLWPTLFGYQFVFLARPAAVPAAGPESCVAAP